MLYPVKLQAHGGEGGIRTLEGISGPTAFVVSDERAVWRLNATLGASLIASSAYQKWPTKDTH